MDVCDIAAEDAPKTTQCIVFRCLFADKSNYACNMLQGYFCTDATYISLCCGPKACQ